MRQKFLREFKKELIKSNYFWNYDIRDVIHIANRIYKKCTKEFKEFKRKRNTNTILFFGHRIYILDEH